MMDVLFNQDYVTQVHENNLVWQGYNQGKEEAKEEIQRAKDETQKGREQFVKSIKLIMSVQNISAEQVMDQLDIDEAEREIIRKMMD